MSLLDPSGVPHDRAELLRGGLVLLATAPTLDHRAAQEGWGEVLPPGKPRGAQLVFLEDMSQSALAFVARGRLESSFDPQGPVLLLLDEDGAVRRALGVDEGASVLFVFAEDGALRHVERGPPSPEAAARAWNAVAAR